MKIIVKKHFLFFVTNSILISIGCLTLLFRIKETQEIYLLFLIWNVFLASIPFIITILLEKVTYLQSNKIYFTAIFLIWLLFLPNSFYIITDFIHLNKSTQTTIWLDIIIMFTFSLSGLTFGYYSLFQMKKILLKKLDSYIASFSIIIILFLCGIGVYLGRYLRWNSWDIIQQPLQLCYDITALIIHPYSHIQAWKTMSLFSLFFSGLYYLIHFISLKNKT